MYVFGLQSTHLWLSCHKLELFHYMLFQYMLFILFHYPAARAYICAHPAMLGALDAAVIPGGYRLD